VPAPPQARQRRDRYGLQRFRCISLRSAALHGVRGTIDQAENSMSFEIMTWAAGFAMTRAAQRVAQSLFSRNLDKELSLAAERWAAQLPDGHGLVTAALFPKILDDEELVDRPALRTVRERLGAKRIPSLVEWHLAFIEQWQHVRDSHGDETQPFFLLPEEKARADLHGLARAVLQVCEQDDGLFKGTVLEKLDELCEDDIPAPFPWQSTPSMRELANTIGHTTGAHVAQILADPAARCLHVWSTIPGTTFQEIKRTVIHIACIASGYPDIDRVEVGIFNEIDLCESDARGHIGMTKLCFDVTRTRMLAASKKLTLAYWDHVKYYVIANDNSNSQFWKEIPLQNLEIPL
jgi:hypothetical protein